MSIGAKSFMTYKLRKQFSQRAISNPMKTIERCKHAFCQSWFHLFVQFLISNFNFCFVGALFMKNLCLKRVFGLQTPAYFKFSVQFFKSFCHVQKGHQQGCNFCYNMCLCTNTSNFVYTQGPNPYTFAEYFSINASITVIIFLTIFHPSEHKNVRKISGTYCPKAIKICEQAF